MKKADKIDLGLVGGLLITTILMYLVVIAAVVFVVVKVLQWTGVL